MMLPGIVTCFRADVKLFFFIFNNYRDIKLEAADEELSLASPSLSSVDRLETEAKGWSASNSMELRTVQEKRSIRESHSSSPPFFFQLSAHLS